MNDNVSIDIVGNENLKVGENIITILVYNDVTGDNSTYQIIVNKIGSDLTEIEDALSDNTEKANLTRRIILGIVIFIVVCIVVFAIVIYKKKQQIKGDSEYDNNLEEEPREFNSAKEELSEKPKKILDEYLDENLNNNNENLNNNKESLNNDSKPVNNNDENLSTNSKPVNNNDGNLNNDSKPVNDNDQNLNNNNENSNDNKLANDINIEISDDKKGRGSRTKGKHF